MGPTRKKARTGASSKESKPPATAKTSTAEPSTQTSQTPRKDLRAKDSWYGTWPRKSVASTQVAKETILADRLSNASPHDRSRLEALRPAPASEEGSPRLPVPKEQQQRDGSEREDVAVTQNDPLALGADNNRKEDDSTGAKPPEPSIVPSMEATASANAVRGSGWFGWFGTSSMAENTITYANNNSLVANAESHAAVGGADASESIVKSAMGDDPASHTSREIVDQSSWFGLWSTPRPQPTTISACAQSDSPNVVAVSASVKVDGDTIMSDAPASTSIANRPPSRSWLFWSSEAVEASTSPSLGKGDEVTKTNHSSHMPASNPQTEQKAIVNTDHRIARTGKRNRPVSATNDDMQKDIDILSRQEATSSVVESTTKTTQPNLLFPDIEDTYGFKQSPSMLQNITHYFYTKPQSHTPHVFLSREIPRVKKAVAIGVHGLVPGALVRTVIGQPTGTSMRFASHAANAIRRWVDAHGCSDCDVEQIALEGEGTINERVDNLWKLMLNWIDHIRKADFIMLACHSQGVPVGVMLVAKLIEFGVINDARIGICAMGMYYSHVKPDCVLWLMEAAGVNLGPFAHYKSRFFATELFDFADPGSAVSLRYADALRVVIKYGARIAFCGSIDDQVVSMESSTFANVSHPYIYRSVFVDGRVHAPDFLSHLVGICLKLRNLGVSDHGLVRELSAQLAGSLYSGEGHSRLYDDVRVYGLAVRFALETTNVHDTPLHISPYTIPTNANPYVLPWLMRGLLEEEFVKSELSAETTNLLKQFDDWKPATKSLKDVKYRLEAVRSKL